MKLGTCGGCKFWDGHDASIPHGRCRRHAPRPAIGEVGVESMSGDYLAPVWPETLPFEFCGEWEALE